MSAIKSKLDTRSPEYAANRELMTRLVAELREKTEQVAQGGSASARAKHVARG